MLARFSGRYDALEFVLIDCEKKDYERFLALLRLAPGAVVVADNILSHGLGEYVRGVRSYPGVESITLAIGKGLEVSRFVERLGWTGQGAAPWNKGMSLTSAGILDAPSWSAALGDIRRVAGRRPQAHAASCLAMVNWAASSKGMR